MTNHTIHNKLNKTTIILESTGENNNSFKKVILVIIIILSAMVLCSIIIFIYIYRKDREIKNRIIRSCANSITFRNSGISDSPSSEISNNNLDKLTDSSSKSCSKDVITNQNSSVEINIMRNAITIHDIELSEIYKKDQNKRLVFNPLNSTLKST